MKRIILRMFAKLRFFDLDLFDWTAEKEKEANVSTRLAQKRNNDLSQWFQPVVPDNQKGGRDDES